MSREPDPKLEIERDLYWALIPEWVLYADISANAVRLYCVLARHADKDTKRCHPTRQTLATLMKASRATVDRALDELEAIEAVIVKRRKSDKGDWTSNQYLVKTIPPQGVSSPVSRPLITGEETGVITRDEQTRVSKNQSHERPRSAKPNDGDDIAKGWWEAQATKPIGGSRAFFALRTLCRNAVNAGHDPAQVRATLDRLGYIPAANILDRELRNPRPETWAEKKAREDREAAERIARRAAAEAAENAERARRRAEEAAAAVPMPDEVRAKIRALTGRGGSK